MSAVAPGGEANAVQVRSFHDHDWPEVRAFYERCYRPGYVLTDRAFFDWYFASPLRADDVSDETLAFAGEHVVGVMGGLPWPLQVRGRRELGQYNVNLMVDPAWRGQGLGQRLLERTLSGVRYAVSNGVEPRTISMYERYGRTATWRMRRWVKVLEADAVAALVSDGPGYAAADPAQRTAVLAAVEESARQRAPARAPVAEPAVGFDAEWDRAWSRLRLAYPFTTWRDAPFLSWRYLQCPRPTYLPLLWRSGGEIRGLLVLRVETPPCGRVVRVVDLVAADGDREELARTAIADAVGRGAILVDIVASSHLPESSLRELGFVELELAGWGTAVPLDFSPVRYRRAIETLVVALDSEDPSSAPPTSADAYVVKGDGDQDRAN